ncbi:MAG TPA: thioredoxin domain-containing protein [Bacteroidia bacterium]|nr:thiol reductase thioredoxin [Bacteroidia bacterium]QQR93924.1 MAG: thiol reductase thioredoxin [Bacteroidota bacterium]MBP7713386.1 thiol reductase thioredoxin [Bacteroidia bacterium]MBP8667831.1 thiol reductase thioredoxin [Bacteroidia bacterium]HOZ81563.1 thioredoxin domain-containing protein [Bacteroidia bacterium]
MNTVHEITTSNTNVLIDFYADWCEPCKWLNPVLEELTQQLPDLYIHKINIDQFTEEAAAFEIKSVPVLILFVDGKQVWRMNGFKYAKELAKELKEFLKA